MRHTHRIVLAAVAATCLVMSVVAGPAPGGDGTSSLDAPSRLSETGLYSDIGLLEVDPGNMPFEPQYPLWTDGATKSRWIRLPDGAAIDTSDPYAWVLPVGTKLWKEFAFDGRKVETRMIWRAAPDKWVYVTYVWNEEQSEAIRAPAAGIRNRVKVGKDAWHAIPAVGDCANCHDEATRPVLGFTALQLSDDRDPLALHARHEGGKLLTIGSLDAKGLLSPPRPELVANPPRIAASSPRERAVLGYLSTNCGSCHNARGVLAMLGMTLESDGSIEGSVSDARATIVDVAGYWRVPGLDAAHSRRIAPGAPEASAVLHRMSSTLPSVRMPPLGTTVVDEEAVALIRAWIREDLE